MSALTDRINVTLLAALAAAIIWIYATFATAAEVKAIELSIWYGQYYDRLDDYDEAIQEGDTGLAAEYARQMERLKAKICAEDPEWERCPHG